MNKLLKYSFVLFLIISCNKEEISNLEKRNEDLIIQTAELQKQLDNLTKGLAP